MAKAKDVDPLKLKRERPGRYVTADGRFAVEGESTGSWYLIHTERQNELGLPLMAGPFATLEDARAEIAAAAVAPADQQAPGPPDDAGTPSPRAGLTLLKGSKRAASPARPTTDLAVATPAAEKPNGTPGRPVPPQSVPEPSEPAWLTRLSPADQVEARRLLALLDRLGIEDPTLARREIEGNVPEIARTLLARRVRGDALEPWRETETAAAEALALPKRVRRHLRAQIDPLVEAAEPLVRKAGSTTELAAFAWLVAVRTAAGVFEALESEGRTPPAPGRPGWRLVELDARGEPTGRAITVDESDLLEP